MNLKKNLKKEKCHKLKNHFERFCNLNFRNNMHSKIFINFYSMLDMEMMKSHKIFTKKIKKIIDFFENIGINFRAYNISVNDDPILLFKSLLVDENLKHKDDILDKIEKIVSKL